MAPKLKWYGIKTIYRAAPVGRRLGSDSFVSTDVTLVEERVVVLRARSIKEAIRKAEVDAKQYAGDRHRNPYGQRVRTRYLGYCDVFDINEPVKAGTEVFSETEVVSRKVSDSAIVNRLIGRRESKRTYSSRRNVLDIEFARPAPGVKLNATERAFREKCDRLLRRHDA